MKQDGNFKVTLPQSQKDWEDYYDLRWRILRSPWNQPKGSERVDDDPESYHAMIRYGDKVIACGRIHLIDEQTAQVRFMAVDDAFQNRGLGTMVLKFLEQYAVNEKKTQKIILQAREEAVPFYIHNGYSVVKKTDLLFGKIQHYLMEKNFK